MVKVRLRGAVMAAMLCAGLGLAGCGTASAPEPTPTASGFADEAEAFAAAEATYRAYVDALNARRSNPDSTPDPQSYLSGEALATDVETQRQLDELGVRIEGDTRVLRVDETSAEATLDRVLMGVCLDQGQTRVLDAEGADVTPVDRPDRQALEVTVIRVGDAWLISSSTSNGDPKC